MSTSARKPIGASMAIGSSKKAAFKEKIVQMYEVLLRGEDPQIVFGQQFWNEFFLLKPKVTLLEIEMTKLAPDQFVACRLNLNRLFEECVTNLECRDRPIRVVYSLQTLCGLVRAVFRKQQGSTTATGGNSAVNGSNEDGGGTIGFDLINALVGFDNAENRMTELVAQINYFLTGDHPASLKDMCLSLMVIICTAVDNVSRNTLMEYLMMNSIFESLVHLLSDSESRARHGQSAILILTLLVQYRKYESTNPYVVKLSILDQEMAFHGYSQVITNCLSAYTSSYEANLEDRDHSTGWFSSITSMVGNMFVSLDEGSERIRVEQMRARNSLLLALYEAVHLNRNFIATLAHYQTESAASLVSSVSNQATFPSNRSEASLSSGVEASNCSSSRESTMLSLTSVSGQNTSGTSSMLEPSVETSTETAPNDLIATKPSNLLVTFLEYCSIVMQDTKSESSHQTVKLSFLILVCITEDQYANALINDPNLVFKVKLHRAPMRHRKPQSSWDITNAQSRSLACSVMDLMVEFIRSHMMKRFPHELYTLALGVVRRLLSYQKRSRVRLNYPWKDLWTSLINLVKFITSNESSLVKKMNVFSVTMQVSFLFVCKVHLSLDLLRPDPQEYKFKPPYYSHAINIPL